MTMAEWLATDMSMRNFQKIHRAFNELAARHGTDYMLGDAGTLVAASPAEAVALGLIAMPDAWRPTVNAGVVHGVVVRIGELRYRGCEFMLKRNDGEVADAAWLGDVLFGLNVYEPSVAYSLCSSGVIVSEWCYPGRPYSRSVRFPVGVADGSRLWAAMRVVRSLRPAYNSVLQ
jgi:hypothetical protein